MAVNTSILNSSILTLSQPAQIRRPMERIREYLTTKGLVRADRQADEAEHAARLDARKLQQIAQIMESTGHDLEKAVPLVEAVDVRLGQGYRAILERQQKHKADLAQSEASTANLQSQVVERDATVRRTGQKAALDMFNQGVNYFRARPSMYRQGNWNELVEAGKKAGVPVNPEYSDEEFEALYQGTLTPEQRLKVEEAARPQIENIPPGHEYGYLDTKTNQWVKLGTTPAAAKTENLSLEEKTAEAWLRQNPGKSLVDYQQYLSSQRMRENASRAQVDGLSPQQFTRVQSLASQFDSNPVIRNYSETVNRYQTVKGVVDRGVSGPGDLSVVFEFMKGLDPTSVVRESEYETAARSGNIFRGWAAKFNGYFTDKGGILPPQVKSEFIAILQEKMGVTGNQVTAMYADFGRRIDNITGRKGTGTDYLTDYVTIFGGGKRLDEAAAREFLRQAGNDNEKARALARDAGYVLD